MSRAHKTIVILFCLGLFLSALPAQAQLAPTPRKSPRTPVKQERLVTPEKTALPASRVVQGAATILDSERVKINGIEMRLFGVVPPLLSASFGPQAREALDALTRSATTCRVRDRTRDGHLLASCRNADNLDFGAELLRRGFAVTARGTLHGTDLATPYIAAEEAAKAQKLGLWSVTPIAASENSILKAAQKEKEKAQAEAAAKEAAKLEEAAKAEAARAPVAQNEKAEAPLPPPPLESPVTAETMIAQETNGEGVALPDPMLADSSFSFGQKGFVETYQLLITGLVLLLATMIGAGAFVYLRLREKRDSLRSIAAALRGELMAARSICLARLSRLAKEGDEKSISWPRLRSIVFQAYVGQLGHLGADLSRQIASIYGQSADYASYYVGAEGKPETASKKQSLQTLVQHIEDVVPRLANIEQRGTIANKAPTLALSSLLARATRPLSLAASPTPAEKQTITAALSPPEDIGEAEGTDETEPFLAATEEKTSPTPITKNDKSAVAEKDAEPEIAEAQSEAAPEIAEEAAQEETKEDVKEQETSKPVATERPVASPLPPKPRPPRGSAKKRKEAARETKTPPTILPTQKAIAAAKDALLAVMHELGDIREPLAEGFANAKSFAADKWRKLNPPLSSSIEDIIPDYANLTEEELEALAYADEYLSSEEDGRKAG